MIDFDALVVGASVSGSLCARQIAKRGHMVAMLEEHEKAGKYGKCTAIVSKNGLDSLKVDYSKAKLNEVKGARIFSGKEEVSVRTSSVQAVVMSRFLFDEACVESALNAGAELLTNRRVVGFSQKEERLVAHCVDSSNNSQEPFSGNVLVGADGAGSITAKLAGFPLLPLNNFAVAYEAEFAEVNVEKDSCYVFLEPEFENFFAWMVPCSEDVARIGFGTTNFHGFEKAKKTLYSLEILKEISKGKKVREFSHLIPLSARRKTQKENVLLVGDAAGQVKATTGGGIVYGGNCAFIAAEQSSNFLEGGLLNYELAWRKSFGGYIAAHSFSRNFLNLFGGPTLLKAFKLLGGKLFLENFGDMDFFVRKKLPV